MPAPSAARAPSVPTGRAPIPFAPPPRADWWRFQRTLSSAELSAFARRLASERGYEPHHLARLYPGTPARIAAVLAHNAPDHYAHLRSRLVSDLSTYFVDAESADGPFVLRRQHPDALRHRRPMPTPDTLDRLG